MKALPWVLFALGLMSAIGLALRGTQQNIAKASSVAALSVPSSLEVDLEAQTYALHYRDDRQESLERSGKSVSLKVPPLTIDIETPAGRFEKPEQTLETSSETTSLGDVYIRQIGVIDVKRPGRYTVRVASPNTGGKVCVGELPTSGGNIFVRSVGVFLLGLLAAVIAGMLTRRRDSVEA